MTYTAGYLTLLLLLTPLSLFSAKADYHYEETFSFPLPETDEGTKWKLVYQKADHKGYSATRYILEDESLSDWKELINIQFKDKRRLKQTDAPSIVNQEAQDSPTVKYIIHRQQPHDVLYERVFPTGEHELVRVVFTNKGLHRIAYVKKGAIAEEEKKKWQHRLVAGSVKHHSSSTTAHKSS